MPIPTTSPFKLYSFTITVEAPADLSDPVSEALVEQIEPIVDATAGAFADALAEVVCNHLWSTWEQAEKLGFKVVVAR